MRRRFNADAAFLSMMVAAAIHRRDGDPRQPRRVQIEVNDEEDVLEQHTAEWHPPFPTATELHDILRIPPAPSCINDDRPLSPVRLVDGRWVNDDSTMFERRYTADVQHPADMSEGRNFPCLPLPDPPPPAQEEEMAPWDDPMIMSTEELAELVGL